MSTVGERIRLVRTQQGLTLTKFAASIGIKHNTLSLIENHDKPTSDRVLNAICHVYNVRLSWLKTGEGEMLQTSTATELGHKFSFKELTVRMLETFEQLAPDQQKAVLEYAQRVVASVVSHVPVQADDPSP